MKQGVWWVVGAAVLVYLFLRPQRGKVGTARAATAGPAPSLGAQVGALADGVMTLGKELFQGTPTPGPAETQGLTVAAGERADFI